MIFNFEVPTPSATIANDNCNIHKEHKKEKQPRHERLKRKRKQRMEERKQKKMLKSNKFNKNDSHRGNAKHKHSSDKKIITKNPNRVQ